jgi:hypothetical protein
MKSSEEHIMKRTIFVLAFLSLTLPASGQGVDPLIGTWKLNLEKSTFTGIPPWRSLTLTFSGEGQNFINTSEGVDDQGPFKVVLRHIYDGQPHPTTGTADYDSTAYTRIGNTLNAVRFKNGKIVTVGQGVIDPGKSYTFREEGVAANDQSYYRVMVFDRQ